MCNLFDDIKIKKMIKKREQAKNMSSFDVLSESDLQDILINRQISYIDFVCKFYVGRRENTLGLVKHFDGNWYHPDYYILVIHNNILTNDEFKNAYKSYHNKKFRKC